MMSTYGTYILMVGTLIGGYNFIKSWFGGKVASSNPWGAATLEWAMPSPPPEYNFAQIPLVKSRYPLWNMKEGQQLVHETTTEEEAGLRVPSASDLHIVLPNPTIWPLNCAAGIVWMFCGLFFMEQSTLTAIGVMLSGTAVWVGSLYKWLTTPLEDAH